MKKLLSVLAVGVLIFTSCSNPSNTQDSASHTEHTYGEWETVKAPTCTEKGQKKHKCTGCDKEETAEIDAKGHSFAAEWETNKDNHWHKATCGHDTEKSALGAHADSDSDGKCDACSFDMTADHDCIDSDSDGKCDICGLLKPTFDFDKNENQFYPIAGSVNFVDSGIVTDDVVPVIIPRIGTDSSGKKTIVFSNISEGEGTDWELRKINTNNCYITLVDHDIGLNGNDKSYILFDDVKRICKENGFMLSKNDFKRLRVELAYSCKDNVDSDPVQPE